MIPSTIVINHHSTKKSVRFGRVTMIPDDAPLPRSSSSSSSSTSSSSSRSFSNLFSSWISSSSSNSSSTWYTADEMQKQFSTDLEYANLWGEGCLRGLEYHNDKDRRKVATTKFVRAVVKQYHDLDHAAYVLGMKVHVQGGVHRFATKLSRQCRADAKNMAERDEQEAFSIHYENNNNDNDNVVFVTKPKPTPACASRMDNKNAWKMVVGKSCHFGVVSTGKRNSPAAKTA